MYLQNMRPGVAEKMGLGYDDLSALNPRLVYCSISGYGDFGPYRDRMAYDAVMQGMTGFAVMQGSKAPGLKPGSASDGPVRDSSPEMLNSLVVDKITSCESATVCRVICVVLTQTVAGNRHGLPIHRRGAVRARQRQRHGRDGPAPAALHARRRHLLLLARRNGPTQLQPGAAAPR